MKRNMFIIIFILVCIISLAKIKVSKLSWQSINTEIQEEFPDVKSITVDELKQSFVDNEKLILVDVRSKKEFDTSHIYGAVNIDDPQELLDIPKNEKIVAYCSVGYRSAIFLEKLKELGFNKLYNLKGSIFKWSNKGYPLYKNNEITEDVHPYNDYWGQLLEK